MIWLIDAKSKTIIDSIAIQIEHLRCVFRMLQVIGGGDESPGQCRRRDFPDLIRYAYLKRKTRRPASMAPTAPAGHSCAQAPIAAVHGDDRLA